ncbi:MAG TPA: SDR family oxidoreductase [Longimicrobiales bacterium]|nr:SDR family oxidoreductase [Longimicrobiales bacterium]
MTRSPWACPPPHLDPVPILYRRAAAVVLLLLAAAPPLAAQTGSGAAGAARADGGGPIVLITGSTDGLGREVALRLAALGAHVIVHGRNVERGNAVVAEITSAGAGSAAFYRADLASLDEVRRLAEEIRRDYDRIDVLVNNAGIWLAGSPERQVSADGHELHFAVNYLSGVLLTRLLLPIIRRSENGRIVNVASGAQVQIDFDDVMLERSYSPGRGYAQSKLAQVLFTMDLAAELEGDGITVTSLHPASLMDTPMVRGAGVAPRSTVEEGAQAVLNLVTSPEVETGTYHDGLRPARAHDQAYDPAARGRLRELTHRLIGWTDE